MKGVSSLSQSSPPTKPSQWGASQAPPPGALGCSVPLGAGGQVQTLLEVLRSEKGLFSSLSSPRWGPRIQLGC